MTRLDEIKKRLEVCESIERNDASQSWVIALSEDIQYLLELVERYEGALNEVVSMTKDVTALNQASNPSELKEIIRLCYREAVLSLNGDVKFKALNKDADIANCENQISAQAERIKELESDVARLRQSNKSISDEWIKRNAKTLSDLDRCRNLFKEAKELLDSKNKSYSVMTQAVVAELLSQLSAQAEEIVRLKQALEKEILSNGSTKRT